VRVLLTAMIGPPTPGSHRCAPGPPRSAAAGAAGLAHERGQLPAERLGR